MQKAYETIRQMVADNMVHRDGWALQDADPNQAIRHSIDECLEAYEAICNGSRSSLVVEEIADAIGCLFHLAIMYGVNVEDLELTLITKLRTRFSKAE